MTAPDATNKAALRRFVKAVDDRKRPAAADVRTVADFVRATIGDRRTIFSPIPRGRGQPKDEDKAFRDIEYKIDAAHAIARRVGKRDPKDADFVAVGMMMVPGRSKESVRRYWRAYGSFVRRQIEEQDAIARLGPALRQMLDRFGDDIGTLSWPEFRPVVEAWHEAGYEKREQLAQEIRRILDNKPAK